MWFDSRIANEAFRVSNRGWKALCRGRIPNERRIILDGPVDQLEDRHIGIVEAWGSNPHRSIIPEEDSASIKRFFVPGSYRYAGSGN